MRNDDHEITKTGVDDFLTGILASRREPLMYRHPLNFLCLPMHRSSAFGLCLHAWLPDEPREEPATSDIHMHTWNLRSRIMCGAVENSLIAVRPETRTPTHRIFEISKRPGDEEVDVLTPTAETVSTAVIRTEKMSRGDQYSLKANNYHRATEAVGGEVTITLVLATDWVNKPERTLGCLHQGKFEFCRKRCSAERVMHVAEELLSYI